jgi:hypothetical protein
MTKKPKSYKRRKVVKPVKKEKTFVDFDYPFEEIKKNDNPNIEWSRDTKWTLVDTIVLTTLSIVGALILIIIMSGNNSWLSHSFLAH